MLRQLSFLLALVAACSRPSPNAPSPSDDIRIRIARAEARRGAGVAELVELAARGDEPTRVLALRGLGRTGGATALAALRTALADRDRDIAAAAAAAIGLAASLEDTDLNVTEPLLAAHRMHDHPAIVEALGRAGDPTVQPVLVTALAGPNAEHAAIALGRHGRRKLALADAARDALAQATAHADVRVRYAATWALAREHITDFGDPKIASANEALAARIADADPEVRAQAIAALARREQVAAAAPTIARPGSAGTHSDAERRGVSIEQALHDADWRVAVEAVRALTPRTAAPHAVASVLDPQRAHVVLEGLRLLAERDDPRIVTALAAVGRGDGDRLLAAWLADLDAIAVARNTKMMPRGYVPKLPAHAWAQLASELVKARIDTVERRRELVTELLAHDDVRVRAAATSALVALWADSDPESRVRLQQTITAAIASPEPVLAGTAIEAAGELYELAPEARGALATAVVQRARGETDVELAASLYGIIGKHAIAAGAPACKQGLAGHPVLATAASECLRALGESPPVPPDPPAAQLPPVDVADVIGKRVTWRVQTTRGELVIELRPEVAPWAVATIATLTRRGFYDGLDFHRVVPNFVVQGGDPTESGWGGPGFTIPAEPASVLDGPGFVAGGVGIADAGKDSGGSQWFVMHSRAAHLDGRYTWIGSVVNGGKSADALLIGDEVVKATVTIADR